MKGLSVIVAAALIVCFSGGAWAESPPPLGEAQPEVGLGASPETKTAEAKPSEGKTPETKPREDLDRAREHFEEAIKALGAAGKKAIEENSPVILEKTGEAMRLMRKQLEAWERRYFDDRRETPRYQPYPPYPPRSPSAPYAPAPPGSSGSPGSPGSPGLTMPPGAQPGRESPRFI